MWIMSSSLVMGSRVARDDAVGELAELLGIGDAAAVERGVSGATERFGMRVRGVEAEDGDVSRLVVLVVLAGGLAERRRRLRDVEDVVDDLEREADGIAILAERLPLVGAGAAAGRAHEDAGAQQRSGLPAVHVREGPFVELQADAREIDRLPARHSGTARGTREQAAEARLQRRLDAAVGRSQHLEGERLHGVAR